ncbi:MAG: translational GTPase TypA [Gammaproteobacteria bacterium]|nr:translational GTPase TypA [Gammaproteobacteria bacterium]
MKKIKNVAIIAHVDHGKTTLVDRLLQTSGALERGQTENRIMDSNELEKERGITILAKNTGIVWKDVHINIIDTPGHADFGGEVERILSMVDAVMLVVDAAEGPMPQTRFVTQKAFQWGLKPIVVINKIDRPGADPDMAIDRVFDLFVNLEASDEQLDFPVIYASALQGFATLDLNQPSDTMEPLLDWMVENLPSPNVKKEGPFQMQISALDYSSYIGMIGLGRVHRGSVKLGQAVSVIDRDGNVRKGRINQIMTHQGISRINVESASAGDVICVAGLEDLHISDTICAPEKIEALPMLTVDEPTINMTFSVNQSPLAGKEGDFVTSRQLRERLFDETKHNVALRVEEMEQKDSFMVSGRGELHLSILIETMRREGFELAVSRPRVIQKEVDGVWSEPYEDVILDIESTHQGVVMDEMGMRKAELVNMRPGQEGRMIVEYSCPTRGLIGFYPEFLSMTSGTGIFSRIFSHYAPVVQQALARRKQGAMVAMGDGQAVAYALFNLQDRGRLFIHPQTIVYEGMVVGVCAKENDLVVNVLKGKQLTNIRASGSDENIQLTPPIPLTLEYALSFINDDELVEITPSAIRLRKRYLKAHERKRYDKNSV